jgi:endonuclease/exonuclease/phosphatase family metal-dependent hydrolase
MTQLTVLTINLRRQDEGDGPNNWPLRKHSTAQCILDAAPHLFGTQEGRKPQVMSLLEKLDGYNVADGHRDWDPNRFYPCVFYRRDAVKVLDSGDRWLSKTPELHASKSWGSAFPRLGSWARCEIVSTGRELIFACAHLDFTSSEARTGQAEVLLELLNEVNPDGLPVILVGDFNDTPGSEAYHEVTNYYDDAWLRCNPDENGADTWHGFTGRGQRGRLDWILISHDIAVQDIEIIHTSYNGIYPSDHFPVKALLDVG